MVRNEIYHYNPFFAYLVLPNGMKSQVLTCAQWYNSLFKVLKLLQIIIGDNKGQLHWAPSHSTPRTSFGEVKSMSGVPTFTSSMESEPDLNLILPTAEHEPYYMYVHAVLTFMTLQRGWAFSWSMWSHIWVNDSCTALNCTESEPNSPTYVNRYEYVSSKQLK